MSLLELSHVDGAYGSVRAVQGICFRLPEGGATALLGRNGAGKSTVLKLVAGALRPTTGRVVWQGQDISTVAQEERIRLGLALVPEGRGIFSGLTVEENLRMGALWRKPKRPDLAADLQRVYDLLPRLGERRQQPGGSLSGGEQQMLAVGRSLMSAPSLLMLDEPSLGLAPQATEALYDLFGALRRDGIALLLVEQYASFALELCDEAVVLETGKIRLAGAASDIAAQGGLLDAYMGSNLGEVVRHGTEGGHS